MHMLHLKKKKKLEYNQIITVNLNAEITAKEQFFFLLFFLIFIN